MIGQSVILKAITNIHVEKRKESLASLIIKRQDKVFSYDSLDAAVTIEWRLTCRVNRG